MANVPFYLQALGLAGFRAYLRRKDFDFTKKRSLAIFAPNGSGKSSVVDGLEFVFSSEGTLERLGQRAIHNQAGPVALAHNRAEEAGIEPAVYVTFVQGQTSTKGLRRALGSKRPMPEIAAVVGAHLAVNPLIRGHSLRSFVEEQRAEERYSEVARWLQLTPLVEVQKSLRALRSQIKLASEDQTTLRRLDSEPEPPRVCRRLFGLSHAASLCSSSTA